MWLSLPNFCLQLFLEDRDTVLNYGELEINEGRLASITYESLQTETDMMIIAETRKQLLEYCKLDTLAMVKILDKLVTVNGKNPLL